MRCLVKCKGKLNVSGQYNLYFSTTLIKTQVCTALRLDTEIAEKLNFVPWFQIQACSELNTSLTLETIAQKTIYYILSHIFTFSLGKRVHYQCYQNPQVAHMLNTLWSAHIRSNRSHFLTVRFLVYWTYKICKKTVNGEPGYYRATLLEVTIEFYQELTVIFCNKKRFGPLFSIKYMLVKFLALLV